MTFGERFQARCAQARVPICVGLDPRLDRIPALVREWALARSSSRDEAVRRAIARFHELAIAAVADLVPAVKPQLAFYEQYGIAGLLALRDTIEAARRAELLVIADGKRNDIPSTAEAYARAYLGRTDMFGEPSPAFEADALTVNPYLGWDSLVPFAEAARVHGTGAFILAHTSNPSAIDLQEIHDGASPIYLRVAELIARLGNESFPRTLLLGRRDCRLHVSGRRRSNPAVHPAFADRGGGLWCSGWRFGRLPGLLHGARGWRPGERVTQPDVRPDRGPHFRGRPDGNDPPSDREPGEGADRGAQRTCLVCAGFGFLACSSDESGFAAGLNAGAPRASEEGQHERTDDAHARCGRRGVRHPLRALPRPHAAATNPALRPRRTCARARPASSPTRRRSPRTSR
jgi:orotidine 5'-phosphate decarboxylase subfamily 2